MRNGTFTIRPEFELNLDQKKRLSELAEAFVVQTQKIAWSADYDFQTFVSEGSSRLMPGSAPQMVLWEKETAGSESEVRRSKSEEQAGAEDEIIGY